MIPVPLQILEADGGGSNDATGNVLEVEEILGFYFSNENISATSPPNSNVCFLQQMCSFLYMFFLTSIITMFFLHTHCSCQSKVMAIYHMLKIPYQLNLMVAPFQILTYAFLFIDNLFTIRICFVRSCFFLFSHKLLMFSQKHFWSCQRWTTGRVWLSNSCQP